MPELRSEHETKKKNTLQKVVDWPLRRYVPCPFTGTMECSIVAEYDMLLSTNLVLRVCVNEGWILAWNFSLG